jgi:hypothetical protein
MGAGTGTVTVIAIMTGATVTTTAIGIVTGGSRLT